MTFKEADTIMLFCIISLQTNCYCAPCLESPSLQSWVADECLPCLESVAEVYNVHVWLVYRRSYYGDSLLVSRYKMMSKGIITYISYQYYNHHAHGSSDIATRIMLPIK